MSGLGEGVMREDSGGWVMVMREGVRWVGDGDERGGQVGG